MSLTIVTSRTYLLCEAINHISLRAEPERINNHKIMPYYYIDINFVPLSRGNGGGSSSLSSRNNDEDHQVCIKVIGEKVALRVYKEIVQQIREQMPDQMYLDKMVENILGGNDIHDDTSATEVSSTRRKKRGSKAILRGNGRGRSRRKR